VLKPKADTLNISYNSARINIIYACDRKKNLYKKFELMLTRRAKAYSSSSSVV